MGPFDAGLESCSNAGKRLNFKIQLLCCLCNKELPAKLPLFLSARCKGAPCCDPDCFAFDFDQHSRSGSRRRGNMGVAGGGAAGGSSGATCGAGGAGGT